MHKRLCSYNFSFRPANPKVWTHKPWLAPEARQYPWRRPKVVPPPEQEQQRHEQQEQQHQQLHEQEQQEQVRRHQQGQHKQLQQEKAAPPEKVPQLQWSQSSLCNMYACGTTCFSCRVQEL